jgi:putative transposase
MEKKIFRNRHYDTPGHAHEITYSVYRRKNLFSNPDAGEMFLDELAAARKEFSFHLWAYVIMPNHVHLLIWPLEHDYRIGAINKAIKGRMAKRFIQFTRENCSNEYLKEYMVSEEENKLYRIWQTGGGFDRNLWNPMAIHQSIEYIEANPVRRNLAASPEHYRWSSAFARANMCGVIPDTFHLPVVLLNPQYQRTGAV